MKTFQYITPSDQVITVKAKKMSFERGTLFFIGKDGEVSEIIGKGEWKSAVEVLDAK